jgi:hypothetical protein
MREWLEDCLFIDDNTMAERLKVAGADKTLVGISYVDATGEVQLRRRK